MMKVIRSEKSPSSAVFPECTVGSPSTEKDTGASTDRKLVDSQPTKSGFGSTGALTSALSQKSEILEVASGKKMGLFPATFLLVGIIENPGMIALMPFAYQLVGIGFGLLFTIASIWIESVCVYFIVSCSSLRSSAPPSSTPTPTPKWPPSLSEEKPKP